MQPQQVPPNSKPPISKEDIVAELWRRGETGFLLHAGQKKLDHAYAQSRYTIFGVECARQFGKTFWGVKKADQIARKFPGSSSRIATAFYTDLDAIILPAFRKLLETCPKHLRPVYKTIGSKFVYNNGSDIRLVGLDRNPDKLRGTRLRLVLLEEAGFGDSEALRYAYDSVIIPAFTHEPAARCVLISTPPQQGNDHSFCELVDEAAHHGSYLKLTIHDNPMLSPERIDEIAMKVGGYDSVAFRREYLCERITDTERAIVPEWSDRFVVPFERDEMYQHWHKYQFMDIGIQVDKTICLFGFYDFKKATLCIEDELEISSPKTTTEVIAKAIREKEAALGVTNYYRRVADNSHPLLLNDLSAQGIHFVATDKARLHEMVNELRIWVKGGRLLIHPRCQQAIGAIKSGIWNKPRTEFERSRTYGHYDALAALVYAVRNVDVYTNPIPEWVINPQRMPLFAKPQVLSPMALDFKSILTTK